MTSFNRLFKLAKKTGDRLIVFDSATGDGFAAIPIDEYEEMVCNPRDISALSGDQLIEQINKDIGAWRESQEEEDDFSDLYGTRDTFSGDWQSAGDVLHDRYRFEDDDDDEDDDEYDMFGQMGTGEYPPRDFDTAHDKDTEEYPDICFDFPKEEDNVPLHSDTKFFVEHTTPEPQIVDMPHPIPPLETPREGMWKEEPLDEDPIFFEEPV